MTPPDGKEKVPVFRAVHHALRREVSKIVGICLAGAIVGWLFDHALLGYSVAVTLYLGIQLRHLRALRQWLEAPKYVELHEPGGIWGDVFEKLLDLQKRNRKRKRKLAAIVSEFQASTAALPDGAVVLGERGEIAWFNKAAQAMLGLRGQQDVGIRIPNLIRNPEFAQYFTDNEYLGEVEVASPINRGVRIAMKIIPYGNNQRLMIVRDVSELRRLETARRDFVANASHELRTPLTVLRGYLDMIEPESRGPGPLAPWRMPLNEMRAQSTRMESLINDMLKLAKLESDVDAKQEVLDVPSVLTRVLEEARAMSLGSHTIEASIDPELFLFGRETEAQSIFSNLVTNAIRYTPPQGRIEVRWFGDEEGAHFTVTDSGIGIADDDIPRLTERFYRVDVGRSRASGGTGLGLSIVKHALQRHEGHLEIQSQLGQGSTFLCHFPPHRVHRAEEPPEKSALAG
ncbi:PAS/PAC sensor signal transduction histidine kinase [Panacagrimonas perspica]|uniref:Phosphate regulon sensor protein PhoR n=1 Tax=Panacagrimonas perspica TaxID=381431 RepID=A0A4R7PFQ5_9GAMM|nr:phosphate regulon sensor histidine kinase PhoR [Panacagrimonas perspica]TDU32529.1 PAS/PAC sensor signal transduction histidine kinase [Panacagrimonas perspica]